MKKSAPEDADAKRGKGRKRKAPPEPEGGAGRNEPPTDPQVSAAVAVAASAAAAAPSDGPSHGNKDEHKKLRAESISASVLKSEGAEAEARTGGHSFDNMEDIDIPEYVRDHSGTLTFPEKLMLMLIHIAKYYSKLTETPPTDWIDEGQAFVVHNSDQLVSEWLPLFFRKCKFSSFKRKLYRWGFRQGAIMSSEEAAPEGSEELVFTNENFQRDRKVLLSNMKSVTAENTRKDYEELADLALAQEKEEARKSQAAAGGADSQHQSKLAALGMTNDQQQTLHGHQSQVLSSGMPSLSAQEAALAGDPQSRHLLAQAAAAAASHSSATGGDTGGTQGGDQQRQYLLSLPQLAELIRRSHPSSSSLATPAALLQAASTLESTQSANRSAGEGDGSSNTSQGGGQQAQMMPHSIPQLSGLLGPSPPVSASVAQTVPLVTQNQQLWQILSQNEQLRQILLQQQQPSSSHMGQSLPSNTQEQANRPDDGSTRAQIQNILQSAMPPVAGQTGGLNSASIFPHTAAASLLGTALPSGQFPIQDASKSDQLQQLLRASPQSLGLLGAQQQGATSTRPSHSSVNPSSQTDDGSGNTQRSLLSQISQLMGGSSQASFAAPGPATDNPSVSSEQKVASGEDTSGNTQAEEQLRLLQRAFRQSSELPGRLPPTSLAAATSSTILPSISDNRQGPTIGTTTVDALQQMVRLAQQQSSSRGQSASQGGGSADATSTDENERLRAMVEMLLQQNSGGRPPSAPAP